MQAFCHATGVDDGDVKAAMQVGHMLTLQPLPSSIVLLRCPHSCRRFLAPRRYPPQPFPTQIAEAIAGTETACKALLSRVLTVHAHSKAHSELMALLTGMKPSDASAGRETLLLRVLKASAPCCVRLAV